MAADWGFVIATSGSNCLLNHAVRVTKVPAIGRIGKGN